MAITVPELISYLGMPPDPPEWQNDTVYDLGGVVSHSNFIWQSTQDKNTSEPGTANANWVSLGQTSAAELMPYLSAAKSKARSAGIPDFQRNAQYDLFIKALAAMYYSNRGMAYSGSYQATAEANARKMIDGFVLELRYATEDPVEGGESK